MGVLDRDITIDEEAFTRAAADLAALSTRLMRLRMRIESLLSTLRNGFNTPCGTIFMNSCQTNLIQPLRDQKLVLDHVSYNLRTSRSKYQSVFNAYQSLNNTISSGY
jgi:hypothetical protein